MSDMMESHVFCRCAFISFVLLSAFFVYHCQSISLLSHRHFRAQMANIPTDSSYPCRFCGLLIFIIFVFSSLSKQFMTIDRRASPLRC